MFVLKLDEYFAKSINGTVYGLKAKLNVSFSLKINYLVGFTFCKYFTLVEINESHSINEKVIIRVQYINYVFL
ncbi:hypothetical protein [Olleya sp. Bg11-27]|uniref:hypothetical protein n=1 Tax=Olleya sp. Bg11-27 TaxID=2058135 RepID=UPI000C311060|nr:hypothetical protein [Olleya sp. Bg11-27]AUC76746.1 hypothetical protein CW732_14100 [Olleya sp. Bg11-27]